MSLRLLKSGWWPTIQTFGSERSFLLAAPTAFLKSELSGPNGATSTLQLGP